VPAVLTSRWPAARAQRNDSVLNLLTPIDTRPTGYGRAEILNHLLSAADVPAVVRLSQLPGGTMRRPAMLPLP
jgi:hypothetical protein